MKVYLENRELGEVAVEIDREDKHLFDNNRSYLKREHARDVNAYVVFPNFYGKRDHAMASRVILEKHGLLDPSKNTVFKNGNSLDLRKSNLLMGPRPKGKK